MKSHSLPQTVQSTSLYPCSDRAASSHTHTYTHAHTRTHLHTQMGVHPCQIDIHTTNKLLHIDNFWEKIFSLMLHAYI